MAEGQRLSCRPHILPGTAIPHIAHIQSIFIKALRNTHRQKSATAKAPSALSFHISILALSMSSTTHTEAMCNKLLQLAQR